MKFQLDNFEKWEKYALYFFVGSSSFDLIDAWRSYTGQTGDYPYGWEDGGFAYKSPEHYAIYTGIHGLLWVAILLMALFSPNIQTRKMALICPIIWLHIIGVICYAFGISCN